MTHRIAVVQMVSGTDVEANLQQAEHWVTQAATAGAKLILLPENFALFDSQQLLALACQEAEQQRISSWLSALAKRLSIWLLAGSVPLRSTDPKRVRQSLLVANPHGEVCARYDKRHLFDADVADQKGRYRESDWIEPGAHPVVVGTDCGTVGLSICYDLRFADHYWQLRDLQAQLLVVPAAFTKVTGEAHWEVLLRARAIETQCYVLGANQGGKHSPERETSGQSMIISPWGTVLARLEQGEGFAIADIDLGELDTLRTKMPVAKHRR